MHTACHTHQQTLMHLASLEHLLVPRRPCPPLRLVARSAAAVGILDNNCAGLCEPLTDMLQVHNDPVCRQQTPDPLPYHHSYPEHVAFEHMWVR